MNIDKSIFDIDHIEQVMKEYWPSTKISHRNVAVKYYTQVKKAITKGIHIADAEAVKFNLIPVSFKLLRDKLGRYGSKGNQKYWFDWFQAHYPLMEPVIQGSNLGRNKLGSLTMIKTTKQIERMLALNTSQEIYDSYYQDIDPCDLDLVTVDLDSLVAYIQHNRDTQKYASSNDKHRKKLQDNEKQAMLIMTLAEYNQGQLPQHKSISDFGRKYYQGPNLQSCSKIIRHAALGDCYQYDIEASVFVWKFDMSKDIDPNIKLPATLDYLDYKQHHRTRLAKLLFDNSSDYSVSTIKKIITSVGFGARVTNAVGWYENGQWTTTAIREIIKSNALIKRLFNDVWFKEFVQEQDLMSALIFQNVKDLVKDIKILQTTSGQLSKNKTISYCYQQAEAMIIKKLERRLELQGNKLMLLCHDGFYTKTAADLVDLRYELQQVLPHARLDQVRHKKFKYEPDQIIFENEHKSWINKEEQQVAELLGKPIHRPRPLRVSYKQRNDEYDNGYDDGSKAYQEPNYYEDSNFELIENPNFINELISR